MSATCCIFEPGSVIAMKRLPTSFSPTFGSYAIEKILLVDVGFERAAGFAGDDADGAAEVDVLFEGFDLRGIGGIEHVQFRIASDFAEGQAQDLRTKAGAAHSKQAAHRLKPAFLMSAAIFFSGQCSSSLLLGDIQPAEPFVFIGAGPQRGVSLPQAGDFSCTFFPIVRARRFTSSANVVGEFVGLRFRLTHSLLRFFRWRPEAVVKASEKSLTPSTRSLSVTSFMEMPALPRLSIVLRCGVDIFGQAVAQFAVIAESVERRGRNGVHGVGTDQLFDVDDVAILRDSSCWCWPRAGAVFARLSRRAPSIASRRKVPDTFCR